MSRDGETIDCPRCGARTELYQPEKWQSTDRYVIRAHRDPVSRGSCWAGGKLADEIEAQIVAHRDRQREARRSAGVEGEK